jgi:ParB family chromosome partitioning protein
MTTQVKTESSAEPAKSTQAKPALRSGLGRGLSALIPQAALPHASEPATASPSRGDDEGASYKEIPLRAISLNPHQPRKTFNRAELDDLEASIREHGVLQPVVVRPKAGGRGDSAAATYELVAGERRFRAASAAGLETIPAVVREMDDQMSLAVALIENIQREDLNIVETAHGYEQLVREFRLTQTELAQAVGKSQPQIANTLRLLGLPPQVLESLRAEQISEGHAKVILSVADTDQRVTLWSAIVARKLTVREAEREAAKYRADLGAPMAMQRASSVPDPDLDEVARRISLSIGTKVRVVPGKGERGAIEIAYYDREQLEGLIERLSGT